MLDLKTIKKHINVDEDYKDDDTYIMQLSLAAEEVVMRDLDYKHPQEMLDDNGDIKVGIQQAMLLLIGTFYGNRESIVYGVPNKLPAYQYLLDIYHDYSHKNYHHHH